MHLRTAVAVLLLSGCSSSSDGAAHSKPGLLPRAAAQEPAIATAAAALPAAASSTGAHGNAAPDPTEELLGTAGSLTTSVGAPARGTLQGAVRLPDRGPGYYHNPRRPDAARFGTVEMLQAIVRAAAVVDKEVPGSSLTVNDLGLEHGGPIAQHGSHQSGRDADILFYVLDKAGKPIPSVGV